MTLSFFTQSQSEDETGSFVSEFAEPIDVITDALKEAEQTDAETEERDDEAEMETEYDEELINQYLRPSTIFPTFLFRNIKPKRCNFLPQNIDGIKYFKVKCSIKNYSKKTSDRRWFYLRTSSKAGLNGICKVGTCKGSWQCTNTSCSFLRTEKKPNTWHFDYRGGSHACYSCGTYAQQLPCGARKLFKWHTDQSMQKFTILENTTALYNQNLSVTLTTQPDECKGIWAFHTKS